MNKTTISILSAIILIFTSSFNIALADRYDREPNHDRYDHHQQYTHEFYGTVAGMPEDLIGFWKIDTRTVEVHPDTYIDKEHGLIGVGSYVEVKGVNRGDTFIAHKIELKRSR